MAKRRFKSMDDVRKYLSWLLNEVHEDRLDVGVASRCAYIANILKSVIEAGDLERRVRELEERLLSK